jgi:excisionase family DNA binding protein
MGRCHIQDDGTMADQLLYRPAEAAALLATNRAMVYALIRSGRLRAVRVGAALRVPRTALEEYVRALPPAGTSAVQQ